MQKLPALSVPQELDTLVAELARRGGEAERRDLLEFFGRPGRELVSAAHGLGLLEGEGERVRLTARGKSYALAGGDDKQFQLLQAMCVFEPYRRLLLEASQSSGDVLDEGWMMAQLADGLPAAERDQKRAVGTLLALMAKADLGKLSDRGRKLQLFRTSRAVITTAATPPKPRARRAPKPVAPVVQACEPEAAPKPKQARRVIEGVTPSVSITVDMTDWGTDQITAFFKAAYGVFG